MAPQKSRLHDGQLTERPAKTRVVVLIQRLPDDAVGTLQLLAIRIAGTGNLAMAAGKGMGKPAFRIIQTHFAAANNVGDVAAKEEVQSLPRRHACCAPARRPLVLVVCGARTLNIGLHGQGSGIRHGHAGVCSLYVRHTLPEAACNM